MRVDVVPNAAVVILSLLLLNSDLAVGRKDTPKGCVRWRFDRNRSQWRYRCNGGRIVLHEEDLSLIDWRTGQLKAQYPSEAGEELECTCDTPGSTFGYICPNVNDCPKIYPANEFLQMASAIRKAAYDHKYKVTGYGALALRYYPGRIEIPDVIARQIEKGECKLQCNDNHQHCEKSCPHGDAKTWICHHSEGLYHTKKTFSAKEFHALRRGLKYGHVYKDRDTVNIKHLGVTYEIDTESANALASGVCDPVCEATHVLNHQNIALQTVSLGSCRRVPCKEYGISHYSCDNQKFSVPQFVQLASMLSKSIPRKVSSSLSNPIYELSDGGHKSAILVEGSVLDLLIDSKCEPTCNEPPSSNEECTDACDGSSIQEYVCEVDNNYRPWLFEDNCHHSEDFGSDESYSKLRKDHLKGDEEAFSLHHLSIPMFNELSLALRSGTCKFVQHPGFPEFSTYSCLGGKLRIPPELFVAMKRQKCTPVCQQEDLTCHEEGCRSAAPKTCKVDNHAVQIHSYRADELSHWVKHGLCKSVSKHSYGKKNDDLWICPGGAYITGETYRAIYNGDCSAGCSQEDIKCKCGDIEPAVHFYSGLAAIKNNVPIAGRIADFILRSTHPLVPLSGSDFKVTGPHSYEIYSTPSFDPTVQYVTVEILESYTGDVKVELSTHTRDRFGSSVCNVDEAYMKYYAKQCFPVEYKSVWVEKKTEESKISEPISIDSGRGHTKTGHLKRSQIPLLHYVAGLAK
ncbi:hypothetical protein BSKO_10717 [Bryopsis sp. KO-2023]|nr:hypothetical protein BSKO_10717 [Bryopsis sp. KO-2023]